MKTQTELENTIGVTRKALRYYDGIGLLVPAERRYNENGKVIQVLYDDTAVEQLAAIQMFARAGYTGSEIKEILKMDDIHQITVKYTEAIERLEAKRREIDETIALLEYNLKFLESPALFNLFKQNYSGIETVLNLNHEANFNDAMDEMAEGLAAADDEEKLIENEMQELLGKAALIVASKKSGSIHKTEKLTEDYISCLANDFSRIFTDSADDETTGDTDDEEIQKYYDAILAACITKLFFSAPGVTEYFANIFGKDFADSIMAALCDYGTASGNEIEEDFDADLKELYDDMYKEISKGTDPDDQLSEKADINNLK